MPQNLRKKIKKELASKAKAKKEKTSKQLCQQHAPNIMCHPNEVFQIPCN
jgi:hypothetical protein